LQEESCPTNSGATEAQKKFYDLEWEQRRRLQVGRKQDDSEQQSEWAHCPLEEISNRNRYANVNPYQGNRVKLRVPEGHSDYINASPIVLESTKSKKVTRFIATQVCILATPCKIDTDMSRRDQKPT
jgi:protein-tyrosine phosphatase